MTINKNQGVCKLCNKFKQLIEAHIIPRSFYELHSRVYMDKYNYPLKRPIGTYDTNILCKECDNLIANKFDTIAKEVLIDKKHCIKDTLKDCYSNEKINFMRLSDQSYYERITKFFISVLWRASISSQKDFEDFTLNWYEDIAKKMILDDQYTEWEKYFAVCICNFNDINYKLQLISPKRIKMDGVSFYTLILGGIKVFVKVDKLREPISLQPCYLNSRSSLLMLETKLRGTKDHNSLVELLRSFKTSIK